MVLSSQATHGRLVTLQPGRTWAPEVVSGRWGSRGTSGCRYPDISSTARRDRAGAGTGRLPQESRDFRRHHPAPGPAPPFRIRHPQASRRSLSQACSPDYQGNQQRHGHRFLRPFSVSLLAQPPRHPPRIVSPPSPGRDQQHLPQYQRRQALWFCGTLKPIGGGVGQVWRNLGALPTSWNASPHYPYFKSELRF